MPLDVDSVRRRCPGRTIHYLDVTDTTMREAKALAAAGCPPGTVVVANEQTAGVGRYGRAWHSERDAGLYVSMVLRPGLSPEDLPAITLALGLGAAEAIDEVASTASDLRWPNDIMLGGKKVAGILVQLYDRAAIAGIGVNVGHRELPPAIATEATSLWLETGRDFSREDLLAELLERTDRWLGWLAEGGKAWIFDQFRTRSTYASGKRVVVDLDGDEVAAETIGLDENGYLLLRKDDGSRLTIVAGGVRAAGS